MTRYVNLWGVRDTPCFDNKPSLSCELCFDKFSLWTVRLALAPFPFQLLLFSNLVFLLVCLIKLIVCFHVPASPHVTTLKMRDMTERCFSCTGILYYLHERATQSA